jgi:hypothetical protein
MTLTFFSLSLIASYLKIQYFFLELFFSFTLLKRIHICQADFDCHIQEANMQG